MSSKFLAVYMGNALSELEDLLPAMTARQVSHRRALQFCSYYRVFGAAALFAFGDAGTLKQSLRKSAQAYRYFLEGADLGDVVTSRARPLFDATAAEDLDSARAIAALLPRERKPVEYEEDFLFVRHLADRELLGGSEAEATASLGRYGEVLQGSDDPRLEVLSALEAKDSPAFGAALTRYLDETRERVRREERDELLTGEEAGTEGRLSVEGMALLVLAARKGMVLEPDYPMVPALARRGKSATLAPDSWRHPG